MKKLFYIFTALAALFQVQTAKSQTVIPGSDFEKWDNIFVELPEGWLTSNLIEPKSASKTTDAYNGKYALRLETVESEMNGERVAMPGFAVSGKLGFSEPQTGFPCTSRPDKLSFYYKYAPALNDTMLVYIELRKTDPQLGSVPIGGGFFQDWEAKSNYTYGEIDIYYDSEETPDSAMIAIVSGTDEINTGSVLFIDYLRFDFHLSTGENLPVTSNNFGLGNIYPQPAKDLVNFPVNLPSAQQVQVEITDMLGKNVGTIQQQMQAGKSIIPLNTGTYKPGVYVYKITAGGQTLSGKFIIAGK